MHLVVFYFNSLMSQEEEEEKWSPGQLDPKYFQPIPLNLTVFATFLEMVQLESVACLQHSSSFLIDYI